MDKKIDVQKAFSEFEEAKKEFVAEWDKSILGELGRGDTVLGYVSDGSADDMIQSIREHYVYQAEITNYHKAIEYLKQNDPSLRTSLELAAPAYGAGLEDLCSKTLATLLYQQELSETLDDMWCFIEEYCEALEALQEENPSFKNLA